ncbi:hypothetical protein F2Q70_00038479 [Brassica cretica]|uniref:DUF7900 domain-containing protein n=2 Tax=Brassica cretica TaxID=69181 RepID=A0A8S9K761_BRACR|nr:hypothetical protein F2Q70_00038479 [Brassica cretica]KAF2619924.1 hypothetical protein F2Q68_00039113 [Brassica cretica]KAF3496853.1 hypothetical protein DY000_02052753 [Brassica cretica]
MEVGSGSSRRSRNSGRRLCFCGLPATLGDHCKYFSCYDEEEGTKWQKRALLEARDEIREKDKVIEQLQKTISQMRSDLANKQNVTEDDENEIVRKFEAFYV